MRHHTKSDAPSIRAVVVALALLGSVTLTGCAAGDEGSEPVDPAENEVTADVAPTDEGGEAADSAEAEAEEEPVEEPADLPDGGVLRVDGVESPDFEGECDINRNNGREDVGSLEEPGLKVLVALSNSEANPEGPMIYTALAEDTFTLRDAVNRPGASSADNRGTLESITELGERSPDGSRELVLVRFAGTLSGGSAVEADVVCELQNAF
ncbi:hypothetical protein [Demequina activiva]|uniref:Lipoprotein n=1 Tax=Demequina activiva TaxID=1582364 RepID=A0A919UGN2_9MICO|nr:hypothetical protein [Demequina activiva]GIG55017.1 hypothetical protein Dac01nite_17690 [Demequina activiva]